MSRRRNTNTRKLQQSANGVHNTSRPTRTDTRHQGDAQDEQQARYRNKKQSSTSLAARTAHNDLVATQKGRGSAIRDEVNQVPAKRKREANDEDRQHIYKKVNTEPGEILAVVATKPPQGEGTTTVEKDDNFHKHVTDLATIKKMSEEERRKFRHAKFGRTPIDPSKAAVSKTASQDLKIPEPTHSVKDNREITSMLDAKLKATTFTPHTLDQNTEGRPVRQCSISDQVVITESHDGTVIETTAIVPMPRQQSAGKIAAKIQVPKVDESRETVAKVDLNTTSGKADMAPPKRNKRKQDDVEDGETIPAKKAKKVETAKVNDAAIKRRNDKIKQSLNDPNLSAAQNHSLEDGISFVAYDTYSIPLLCSHSIEHRYPFEIVDKPSDKLKRSFDNESEAEVFGRKMLVLRQQALRLSRKRFWTSEDLGRKKTLKSEPAKIVDNCDLYLYNGKVHMATEQGLLIAAAYLKLIGVPDTQPVRFDGHKPAWMGLITARPEPRRVLRTWEPTPALREGGCISIMSGSIVAVYEHGVFDIDTATGEESQMAYGARMDDGIAG